MVQFLSDAEVDAILEYAEKQQFVQGECKGERNFALYNSNF